MPRRKIPYQLVRGWHRGDPQALLLMRALDVKRRGFEIVANAIYQGRFRCTADGVTYRVAADGRVIALAESEA